MRNRIFVLAVAILLISGVVMAVNPPGPGTGDIMGQGKYAFDPHRTFRLVRYAPQGTAPSNFLTGLAANSIVVWDITEDDGVTINGTTISGDSAVAGVIVNAVISRDSTGAAGNSAQDDAGQVNWTWLQTYGRIDVRMGTASAGAGDALGTSNTVGGAGQFTPNTLESTQNGNAGFFYDDGTTGGTAVQVFIKCE